MDGASIKAASSTLPPPTTIKASRLLSARGARPSHQNQLNNNNKSELTVDGASSKAASSTTPTSATIPASRLLSARGARPTTWHQQQLQQFRRVDCGRHEMQGSIKGSIVKDWRNMWRDSSPRWKRSTSANAIKNSCNCTAHFSVFSVPVGFFC